MLNRKLYPIALSLAAAAGCSDRGSAMDTGETAAQTDTSSTGNATTSSTSASGSTGADTSSSDAGSSETTSSSSSESSTGTPIDPCPPGAGVDWPRRAAYLKLANQEDFAAGPLEISCSIERALSAKEIELLFPLGTVGGIELSCAIPESENVSTIHVAVTLPEAVPGLETLVGNQDVVLSFFYGGPYKGGGGPSYPGFDTLIFGIRDGAGPLFLAQESGCDGPIKPPSLACELLTPPFMTSPTWADPILDPSLADVGCGTRPWEYDQRPMPGTYTMNRLAVRIETDDGVVDAIDHLVTPLSIEGNTYEFFATEVVGEVDDPAVIFDSSSYGHFVRFLIIRTP